jgi:5-methylcytosine-specific restriction endonuclease McrA
MNVIRRGYIRHANRRGHSFDLTTERFEALIQQECHYCGNPAGNAISRHGLELHYNGIDRLDSAKGYVEGNVVPCCGHCNKAKLNLSHDDFLRLVGRIAAKHGIVGVVA